ncbi:MAG: hypothetical protein HLUCCA09_01550 [Rhodobacteraceae bacterium HLUCCA09]|nr:MAG: hypothetical protein HLUCCA09_01550 [Rhodobacteraceae bacterium HLUCCA09]
MTTLAAPLAPPLALGSTLPSAAGFARAARDAGLAACLVLFATAIAWAEMTLQDWIPAVLDFPADAEVVTDREIGSTVRMFSVSTGEESGPLLAAWEEALSTSGYAIQSEAEELVEGSIEFSGPGIANAKIVANRTTENGQTLIEFDATLN